MYKSRDMAGVWWRGATKEDDGDGVLVVVVVVVVMVAVVTVVVVVVDWDEGRRWWLEGGATDDVCSLVRWMANDMPNGPSSSKSSCIALVMCLAAPDLLWSAAGG